MKKYKHFMKSNKFLIIVIMTMIIVASFFVLKVNKNQKQLSSIEKDKIVATFFPYYLILKDLKVSADVVVNPYTNPHLYTPSIQDYKKIENAEYVVVDGYMDKELIKHLPSSKIIDPTPYRHGWLRFDTVYNLSQTLKERGIPNKVPPEIYVLDKKYKGKFKGITAVALHKGLEDALSYYGIKVVRALVAHDDETLSINDINYLRNTDACLIIVTSQGQKKMLEEAGIKDKVVYINVMGRALSRTYFSESYIKTMEINLKAIDDAAERCISNG